MSKSNTFEDDFLKHVFQNAAITLVGDAIGLPPSATTGSLYVSLHTADPTEAGSQNSSEASYSGYARVATSRNSTVWPVASGVASNGTLIYFGAASGATGVLTYVGVGTASSGAGKLLYYGALSASISGTGISPEFAIATLTFTED